jgi:hypothetical protein
MASAVSSSTLPSDARHADRGGKEPPILPTTRRRRNPRCIDLPVKLNAFAEHAPGLCTRGW